MRASRFLLSLSVFIFVLISQSPVLAAWLVRLEREGTKVEVISIEEVDRDVQGERIVLRSIPSRIGDEGSTPNRIYEEILYRNKPDFRVNVVAPIQDPQREYEVRSLVEQGPTANRINLTITGDGYTEEEREKFFEDAQRITDDLFKAEAFSTYLPLFNVYAVYTPSNESGISDRVKKDTAFGLYRSPKGSKRAIFPGSTWAIDRALAKAPATDYPIVIANDDYYGGLGGRYAISTRSIESGSMVLRHELGHNFGEVGEEYNGGQVYSGANFSRSKDVKWQHWTEGEVPVFDAELVTQDYVWQELENNPYQISVKLPEATEEGKHDLDISLSSVGWAHADQVGVYLDGKKLEYDGVFTDDRSFFDVVGPVEFEPGSQTFKVIEEVKDGDNVLASVEILALSPGYDKTPDLIGAFPVFDNWGRHRGYRPTHNYCIMRNMRHSKFCKIDIENMWLRFLKRLELVDSLRVVEDAKNSGRRMIELKTLDLQHLDIRWFSVKGRDKEELAQFRGMKEWAVPEGLTGTVETLVELKTPEVRVDDKCLRSLKQIAL